VIFLSVLAAHQLVASSAAAMIWPRRCSVEPSSFSRSFARIRWFFRRRGRGVGFAHGGLPPVGSAVRAAIAASFPAALPPVPSAGVGLRSLICG